MCGGAIGHAFTDAHANHFTLSTLEWPADDVSAGGGSLLSELTGSASLLSAGHVAAPGSVTCAD